MFNRTLHSNNLSPLETVRNQHGGQSPTSALCRKQRQRFSSQITQGWLTNRRLVANNETEDPSGEMQQIGKSVQK